VNDFAVIVVPVWAYWLIVVWVAIESIKTTLGLVNQFLQWRVTKLREKNGGQA
jgi:hypothetical protein